MAWLHRCPVVNGVLTLESEYCIGCGSRDSDEAAVQRFLSQMRAQVAHVQKHGSEVFYTRHSPCAPSLGARRRKERRGLQK